MANKEKHVKIWNGKYQTPSQISLQFATQVEQVSLLSMDGREISCCNVNVENFGIRVGIPKGCSGLHLLRMVLSNGSVVTRKIIIR